MNEIEVILNQEHVGQRMDVLVSSLADVSRAYAQKLIAQGYVWCNDAQVSNSMRASEDDQLLIQVPKSESLELQPVAMELDIVYEDSDVLVVNKPAGMVVHPAPSYDQPTLVEGLLAHCNDLSGINGVSRPGIVHRIDKDTSGLLVVAKNDHAHQSLSNQLVDKSMKRVYHALVHGQVFPDVFNIDAPIGRDPNNRQNMAVTEKNSKPAFTTVVVLERYDDASLVACSLKTGRTHQIRVHMQFIGFPLFCDPKYGIRKDKKTGQLLHAKELEFVHPTSGEIMHFVSDYPEYFAKMLKEVKERTV